MSPCITYSRSEKTRDPTPPCPVRIIWIGGCVAHLKDADVHRRVLLADALVEQRRAEGDERRGADAVEELAEVEEPPVPRQ